MTGKRVVIVGGVAGGHPDEYPAALLPGALQIPLGRLRGRLGEVDRDAEWIVACPAGLRSYLACRILEARGVRCRSLNGGTRMLSLAVEAGLCP